MVSLEITWKHTGKGTICLCTIMHYYRSTVGHLFVFPHVLMRFGGEVTKFTFQHLSLLQSNLKIFYTHSQDNKVQCYKQSISIFKYSNKSLNIPKIHLIFKILIPRTTRYNVIGLASLKSSPKYSSMSWLFITLVPKVLQ